jgi:hypothetical protein
MIRSSLTFALATALVLLAGCGSSPSYGSSKSATASAPAATASARATSAAVATASATTQAAAATPATNPVERISGTVEQVQGSTVALKDGKSFMLGGQTNVTRRVAGSAASLQSGETVAVTAKRQPDNTLLASLITVFPTSPAGFPLGQRPLDGGDLMTNATIDQITDGGFTVTFPGGGGRVALAPNAQITVLTAGSAADITSGESVTAAVRDGVAQTVSIQ